MTKILTPSSDLDIAVLEVPEGNMTTTDLLYELEKAILSKGLWRNGYHRYSLFYVYVSIVGISNIGIDMTARESSFR